MAASRRLYQRHYKNEWCYRIDFKENLSEDISVEFQELSETGGNELQLQFFIGEGKPDEIIRIYDEDIPKLREFLNKLNKFGIIKYEKINVTGNKRRKSQAFKSWIK